MSIFCPECGVENPDGETLCDGCGRDLDLGTEGEPTPSRPTRWLATGILAATSCTTVVLSYLLGLSLNVEAHLMPPVEEGGEATEVLLIDGSAFLALFPMSGFIVGALIVSLLFRGRFLREVSLGVTVGALAQIATWMISLGSDAGLFFSADLHLLSQGGGARVLAFMVLLFFPILFVFAGLTTAIIGWVFLEQITGKAQCLHCRKLHRIRPTPPPRCPSCKVSLETEGVQWPWVMAGAVVTGGAFYLTMVFAGQPLDFFYHCDPFELTDACRAAVSEARESSSWMHFRDTSDRSDAHLLLFHQWKYIGYMAILMLLAPALLGVLLRRGSRISSGVAIVINWAVSTMVAVLVVARSGGFEGVYLWLLRLQVMSLIAWGITGFIGAMIGYSIRSRVALPTRDSRLSLAPARESLFTPVPTGKALDDKWAIANRRRRVVIALLTMVVIGGGGGAAAVWIAFAPDPLCDRSEVQALLDHPEIPASAMHSICEFPEPLETTLRSIESAPPGYSSLLAMRLATQAPQLMEPACPAYAQGLAAATRAAPQDKAEVFWQHCDLSDLGLSQSDIDGQAFGNVILAMAVHSALRDTDSWAATRLAQRIVRGQ